MIVFVQYNCCAEVLILHKPMALIGCVESPRYHQTNFYVGAASSRDLPGQSRLKTAPTIQKQQIQNYKVSFPIRLDARGQRQCLYEISWNDE